MNRTISVMIKPASSLCNLRCRYCFYADISENRMTASSGIMKEETADVIISRIYEALEGKGTANISFQGGEPTLAGIGYFRHFMAKMKEYPGIRVNYALQTNGTMITDEWAEFFHEHHVLTGVSIDGYKLNMDRFRMDAEGKSVFDGIIRGTKILTRHHVEFNVLTVVTKDLASHAKGLFRFYKENRFSYIQLIPCLPGLFNKEDPFALTPQEYASFYIEFFDEWMKEVGKGNMYSVNLFENLYAMAHGQMPYQCGMLGRCSAQFVIESDGKVYPCDFYCLDEYLLGNLHETSFREMAESDTVRRFLQEGQCAKKPCETCRYRNMCSGGCRRQNICYLNDDMCAYRKVLDHVMPVLSAM